MERAHRLGMEFAQKHFPGHQALVCTHDEGHNESGNIHVHIVLNSLRIRDTEELPFQMRPCDTKHSMGETLLLQENYRNISGNLFWRIGFEGIMRVIIRKSDVTVICTSWKIE